MRVPLKSRTSGPANSAGSWRIESGARGSYPAITDRNIARSGTVRAIGPFTEIGGMKTSLNSDGTRPNEVRKPKTLFHAAGFRSEPPLSLPSATGTILSASATAAPPLLPPQVFD